MNGGLPLIPVLPPLNRFPLSSALAVSYTGVAMRRLVTYAIVFSFCAGVPLGADGNSWNKIRYSGGTFPAKVNPYDWNTTLTITPDAILLDFGRRQTLKVVPAQVTALSYGKEAHRRVADMVALSLLLTPVALFGLLHQSKNHFIGIEYRDADGKTAAVLLEADKNNYRVILRALKTVTGKPVQNEPA